MIDKRAHWAEVAFAVLMATATVLTAWCAYQSARWNGVQAISAGEANALRSESIRQSSFGNQRMAVDVGLWVRYISALKDEDQRMADFLSARFPEELKAANSAWLNTDPLHNPDAPPSPFAMPDYKLPSLEEAQRLADTAAQRTETAVAATEISNDYVLLTVIFASILFIVGIGSKFETYRLRLSALICGALVLLAVFGELITYPVH